MRTTTRRFHGLAVTAAFLGVTAAGHLALAGPPQETPPATVGDDAAALAARHAANPDWPGDDADGWLALAVAYGRLDRPWDAEAAYGQALALRPDDTAAILGRGRTFLDLAASLAAEPGARGAEIKALAADAVIWLGRGVDTAAPDSAARDAARFALARAELLALDHEAATRTLEALVERDAENPAVHHRLAEARRGLGDREGAAEAEQAALDRDPAFAAAAAARIGDLAALDRPRDARATGRDLLIEDPTAEPVYRALWILDAAPGRWTAFEAVLLRVLERHPDHPTALHYLAFARLSAGRRDDALEAFRRKAAVEPENVEARLQIGRLLVALDDKAGAEEALVAVLDRTAPDDRARADALTGLEAVAAMHGRAGDHGEAERLYRRLVAEEPERATFRMFLGLSLRRQDRFAEAEPCFQAAIERAPFDGAPLNELGLLYLAWDRRDDARRIFTEAAAADPRLTDPLENLGALARLEGDLDAAVGHFRGAHDRAATFRDEEKRLKYRRYLDIVLRERERAESR